jgi:hypothetical protein
MQITLNIKKLDAASLKQIGYALVHSASEAFTITAQDESLEQAKAVISEIESRKLSMDTSELWEMVEHIEAKRNAPRAKRYVRKNDKDGYHEVLEGLDAEGNLWTWSYGRNGKRVRVCIPAR